MKVISIGYADRLPQCKQHGAANGEHSHDPPNPLQSHNQSIPLTCPIIHMSNTDPNVVPTAKSKMPLVALINQ